MAEATSPAAGRCYGVARVCQVWEVPRSSFYAARQAARRSHGGTSSPAAAVRSRPSPTQDLLAAIRADLARSPWTGEGHRKVWARLRALDGIRVSRKRVLRLMREHRLLSPHRARTRPETSHERHIITEAPNVMWAIDATQVTTVRTARSGCSASSSTGMPRCWAGTWPSTAPATRRSRRSAWRCASSSAIWRRRRPRPGAAPRPRQQLHGRRLPEADEVLGRGAELRLRRRARDQRLIERLFRTLKEQAIHGRIFQTIDDVRDAVRAFVARYNAEWLIEKNGHRSPADMRAAWQEETFRRAA